MIETFLIMTSIHLDNSYDYNETNPGIIIGYEQVYAGCYRNSFDKTSCLLGYGVELELTEKLSVGALAGGITGYEYKWTKEGVTAFVTPYVSYEYMKGHKPTAALADNAIAFGYRIEF
jgi:hypothetical protein